MIGAFDVAVVGGGPAGLSACVFLARYLRSVVLIDSGDPRNWETRGIHCFLGLPGIKPAELRARGRDEARRYGVRLVDGCVERVRRRQSGAFTLSLEDGTRYHGRRLLLAIGLKDVWPAIPGLRHVYGETAHVCPDCDGFEAKDRKTVVIGHGRKAVRMALNLATWTREIIICTNGAAPEMGDSECHKLVGLDIPVLTERVMSVGQDSGRLNCLELENGMSLDAERLFFAIGQYPADDLGAQLGCDRDAGGHIVVDRRYRTSVRHVFAAGDIVPGSQLAVVAAAEGATASLAIHRSLKPDAVRLST